MYLGYGSIRGYFDKQGKTNDKKSLIGIIYETLKKRINIGLKRIEGNVSRVREIMEEYDERMLYGEHFRRK